MLNFKTQNNSKQGDGTISRVREIREDKNWFDIMSISEVKAKKLQLASTSNRRRSNRNDMDGDSNSDYNH